MSNSLPATWTLAGISTFGSLVGGKTPSKSNPAFWIEGTIPWVSPKDMKRFEISLSEDLITEDAFKTGGMNLLETGSVLVVTRSGILAHTLPVAITTRPVAINQDLKAIAPSPAFNSRYLAYALRARSSEILASCTKAGTTVSSVETSALADLPLPLAPLAEQQRIADKLDIVLARVDAVNDRLARVAPLLKRFRQSVLAAATSGRLTKTEESEPNQLVKLGMVCKLVNGFAYKSSDFRASGIPLVRISDIRDGRATFSSEVFVPESLADDKFIVRKGDILVAMSGATTGKIGIYRSDTRALQNQRVGNLKIIRPDLISEGYRNTTFFALSEQILENAYGGAQPNISSKDIEEFEISLPPLDEQTEIVRRVDLLFAFADRLEARLQAAQTASARLTPALLAKAFRGELVPQDPNDEPAAELLKRLAQSKPEPTKKPRARKATT